jgi:hypothetical protein
MNQILALLIYEMGQLFPASEDNKIAQIAELVDSLNY